MGWIEGLMMVMVAQAGATPSLSETDRPGDGVLDRASGSSKTPGGGTR